MNAASPMLAETERQRLLQTMGFDIWVRRGSEPLAAATTGAPKREPPVARSATPSVAAPAARRTPAAANLAAASTYRSEPEAARVRPLSGTAAMRLGAQAVLLILEKRVDADAALVRHLMLALPGCMICTPDTVSRGAAKFALQIGVEALLPADVLGVRVPALPALRQSASARRSLWWSIKPMLKALNA
jgi:hypothetical protein